jgi:7-cyano-7-deazaguanine synthase
MSSEQNHEAMMFEDILAKLPDTKGAIVILSGGMDSTISLRLCIEKYGKDNVRALTYFYGQRQSIEIEKAKFTTKHLGVKHKVFDLSVLGEISKGFSANVDTDISMPTIKDVLGDPRPKTYVPNRNMILMSVAAAFAEVEGFDTIVMGLQIHDEYGYHDTTARFVSKVNDVLSENRIIKIKVIAPFAGLSKFDEIKVLQHLDGNVDLLANTLTCYNPDDKGHSCGKCPSCSERIANFAKAGLVDPIPYSANIPWSKLLNV